MGYIHTLSFRWKFIVDFFGGSQSGYSRSRTHHLNISHSYIHQAKKIEANKKDALIAELSSGSAILMLVV